MALDVLQRWEWFDEYMKCGTETMDGYRTHDQYTDEAVDSKVIFYEQMKMTK